MKHESHKDTDQPDTCQNVSMIDILDNVVGQMKITIRSSCFRDIIQMLIK